MFYTVVVNGTHGANDVVNLLYYRDQNLMTWPNAILGGAESLINSIETDVLQHFLPVMTTSYKITSVKVYPHNELFEFSSQIPVEQAYGDDYTGTLAPNRIIGSAPAINFNFTLRPAGPQGGFYPPRRGYIALGPLDAVFIDNAGRFVMGNMEAAWNTLAAALTNNVSDLLFNITQFVPIRVARRKVPVLGIPYQSFADVVGGQYSQNVSWRRSRVAE